MQKTLTLQCRRCSSEEDCFATCGLMTTSISWKAVKTNSNNSLKDWRKQLLTTTWKSAPTKQNSRQQHQANTIYQHTDEWKTAGRSGPVQILRIHTKRRNITLQEARSDWRKYTQPIKLAILWKNNAISFPPKKNKLYK